jgi:hypothetical protein
MTQTLAPQYRVNRAQSQQRAAKLQAYIAEHVWDPATRKRWPDFCCAYKTECKVSATRRGATFVEAQGHALGPHYDLSTDKGVPFRVMVVPMEAGGRGAKYRDLAARTAAVRDSGRKAFKDRNPHMQGVTLALQLAFGLPVGSSEEIDLTNGKSAHLFDAFAMTNLLMCSSVAKKDSQASKSTKTMLRSCATHLAETVDILKPTLVISQGWGMVDILWETLGVTKPVDVDFGQCYLSY